MSAGRQIGLIGVVSAVGPPIERRLGSEKVKTTWKDG